MPHRADRNDPSARDVTLPGATGRRLPTGRRMLPPESENTDGGHATGRNTA
jgi:hypothetical protein